MTRRTLTSQLALYSKGRTTSARLDIERVLAALTEDLHAGRLAERVRSEPELLKHAGISKLAGKGWNFLNGPLHRNTTKVIVTEFLDNIRPLLAAQIDERCKAEVGQDAKTNPVGSEVVDSSKTIAELETTIARLWDQVHGCKLKMHEMRIEIRRLKAEKTPKVVQHRDFAKR